MDQHPPRPGRGRGRGCEKASDDGRRGARARYNDAQHDLETWSSDARVIVIIVRRQDRRQSSSSSSSHAHTREFRAHRVRERVNASTPTR